MPWKPYPEITRGAMFYWIQVTEDSLLVLGGLAAEETPQEDVASAEKPTLGHKREATKSRSMSEAGHAVDSKQFPFEYWLSGAEDIFGEACRGDLHSGGRRANAPCRACVLGVG